MRIAVFGAGSVGGYFGGRLAQAGEDVVFIARGDHLKAIQREGLRVESIEGDFVVQPAQASDDPAAVGPVDAILVCVKAWQVPQAAEALRPMIGAETVVVPLQNGVEAPSQLEAVLGPDHVLGGLCRIMSSVVAPGHIRHAGIDPYVAFGRLDKQQSHGIERLREAFSRAKGVRVEIPADIRVAMWRKFLLIAAWSGLGALTRAPIGLIRTQPETREMLQQALQEIHAVAVAHRVALPHEAIGRDAGVYRRSSTTRHSIDATRYHRGTPVGTSVAERSGGAAGTGNRRRGPHAHFYLSEPSATRNAGAG